MNKILKYYFLFSISILFTQEINDIKSITIAENLNRPVFVVFEPATNQMYAVEQTGKIYLINNLQNKSLFLDLSKKISVSVTPDERGLLGMVFDPNFQSNGFFYVSYIDTENYSVVSRFRLSENKDEVDIGSEKKLIYFEQPFNNHNGSHLDFNPIDNYLYISFGDGGSSGDPYGNAQNLHNFFGSILRIDPQDDGSYLIPNDNPLVLHKKNNDSDIKSEIWAYGLRNVWRFSFDNNNGDIYMGDVGQYLWEEINYLEFGENGGNFGWNIMEGNHCYPEPGCDKVGFINPIFEYPSDANYPFSLMGIKEENVSGCSVTGGYIYRGDQIKSLYGLYIFSDFCTGKIWALDPLKNIIQEITAPLLGSEQHMISSFGQDINNEIYIVEFSGKIYKIEPHYE
ncbi:MAG TPA: PQQ-dependent sugar dehydrogenase [Candidatus Marinimicrobia bacterium]|mgnify:FL=1|nr:PQQ-dependent sugar dehydrogenase [Candidatus Neomarinimicrobiota bacterium]|tara:strand:- start:2493 stop:3686 length:1194 start_codon:yes stop_codon:yes gene_type:complete